MTIEATHFWIEMRNETSYGTHHIVGSQSENIVCARSDIQSKKKSSIDLSAPRTQDTPRAARMTRQIKWERAGKRKRNASEIRAREREKDTQNGIITAHFCSATTTTTETTSFRSIVYSRVFFFFFSLFYCCCCCYLFAFVSVSTNRHSANI